MDPKVPINKCKYGKHGTREIQMKLGLVWQHNIGMIITYSDSVCRQAALLILIIYNREVGKRENQSLYKC